MPRPELLYAQVVKTMRRRRIVEVKHRVVFGTKAAGGSSLGRLRLADQYLIRREARSSLRQRVATMRRRSATP
jgi:hypothetical protein